MLQINGALWAIWALFWKLRARDVNRTVSSEGMYSRILHLGPTVIAFLAIFTPAFDCSLSERHFLPNPEALRIVGNLITAVGLGFAIWARVHLGRYWSGIVTLKEGHRLIRTGPYQFARHPIYTGMLSGFIGSVMVSGKISALASVLILALAYLRKIKLEERVLLDQFGDEYTQYKKDVKALIPGVL